jgi:hypothetical protein
MMLHLNSGAHGLVDPTPTATISLCAFSAVMFLLFFILAGYNYGPGFGNYFFPQDLSVEYARMNLGAAILGVSPGLIASVVRYRHPIASTFSVVTLAPFLGLGLLLCIAPALAGGEKFSRAMTSAVLQLHIRHRLLTLCRWRLHCRPRHSKAIEVAGCESRVSFVDSARHRNNGLRGSPDRYISAEVVADVAGSSGARQRRGIGHHAGHHHQSASRYIVGR